MALPFILLEPWIAMARSTPTRKARIWWMTFLVTSCAFPARYVFLSQYFCVTINNLVPEIHRRGFQGRSILQPSPGEPVLWTTEENQSATQETTQHSLNWFPTLTTSRPWRKTTWWLLRNWWWLDSLDSLGFGVWVLVGFQFLGMETVMCYPICIREFMLILFWEFFINGVDKWCTYLDKWKAKATFQFSLVFVSVNVTIVVNSALVTWLLI